MPIGDIIEENEEILRVAAILSKHSDLWIRIGTLLYIKMTERSPLSNHETDVKKQDLRKYQRMLELYKQVLGKPDCPVHWRLDEDNRPIWNSKLSEFVSLFSSEAEALRRSDFPLKTSVIKSIQSTARLFESLKRRSFMRGLLPTRKYRTDGYEAMFFSELVQWLAVDLPRSDIAEQSTANMVLKRIKYCEAVQQQVLVYRDDSNIHNPKSQLARVIGNLKQIHKNCLKAVEAVSFNKCIESIDKDFSEMVVLAFDICHLIIKDVNQDELQVDEFLRPTNVDKKVLKLLDTTMGQWIKNTLEAAGVKENDFNSNKEVTLEAVENHLKVDFHTIPLATSGLLPFAVSDRSKAIRLLKQIADIHRAILNMYHVRASLVKSASVSVNYGENWLHGNNEGKGIVQALLIVIENARQHFLEVVECFWEEFYTRGYEPYANGRIDANDPIFQRISIAANRNNLIKSRAERVTTTLDTIKTSIKNFKIDANVIEKSKRDLIAALYAYLQQMPAVDPVALQAIRKLFEKDGPLDTVQEKKTTSFIPENFKSYIVKFPLDKVPVYNLTKNRLFGNAVFRQDLTLMQKPTRFYTKAQERLYNDFLVPYHDFVTAPAILLIFLPTFYSLGFTGMEKLRNLYSHFNAIMKKLYEPCANIDGYSLSQADGDLSSYENKKIYLTFNNDRIKYKVKHPETSTIHVGYIDISAIDPDFSRPVTFDKLQTYLLKILCITVERGHTVTEPETFADGTDEIFYPLRKNGVQKAAYFWEIQLQLIDEACKTALHRFSQKFTANTFNMLASEQDFSNLQVRVTGNEIELSIDKALLSYASGTFAAEYGRMHTELDLMRTEAHKKDRVIEDQDGKLAKQEQTILGQDETINNLTSDLANAEEKAATDAEVMKKLMSELIIVKEQLHEYEQRERQAPPSPNPHGFFPANGATPEGHLEPSNGQPAAPTSN